MLAASILEGFLSVLLLTNRVVVLLYQKTPHFAEYLEDSCVLFIRIFSLFFLASLQEHACGGNNYCHMMIATSRAPCSHDLNTVVARELFVPRYLETKSFKLYELFLVVSTVVLVYLVITTLLSLYLPSTYSVHAGILPHMLLRLM